MTPFKKVTIIGVGLIGGSLAKVLKVNGLAEEICGAGRSRESLERAMKLGVIDRIANSAAEAVKDADLVVLASPVGSFTRLMEETAPAMQQGTIVTDVGSVKGELVAKIEKLLPAGVFYVPGHPIAGRETSGAGSSTETLFRGARCILTPTAKTDRVALEKIRELWTTAGATVVYMDPEVHDHVFAAVSHLPHVAAYALVNAVAGLEENGEGYLGYTGGGFRDFTRIAASSPELWRDICLMNRKNVIEMIERFQLSLNKLKRAVRRKDGGAIEEMFRAASDARKGLG